MLPVYANSLLVVANKLVFLRVFSSVIPGSAPPLQICANDSERLTSVLRDSQISDPICVLVASSSAGEREYGAAV